MILKITPVRVTCWLVLVFGAVCRKRVSSRKKNIALKVCSTTCNGKAIRIDYFSLKQGHALKSYSSTWRCINITCCLDQNSTGCLCGDWNINDTCPFLLAKNQPCLVISSRNVGIASSVVEANCEADSQMRVAWVVVVPMRYQDSSLVSIAMCSQICVPVISAFRAFPCEHLA